MSLRPRLQQRRHDEADLNNLASGCRLDHVLRVGLDQVKRGGIQTPDVGLPPLPPELLGLVLEHAVVPTISIRMDTKRAEDTLEGKMVLKHTARVIFGAGFDVGNDTRKLFLDALEMTYENIRVDNIRVMSQFSYGDGGAKNPSPARDGDSLQFHWKAGDNLLPAYLEGTTTDRVFFQKLSLSFVEEIAWRVRFDFGSALDKQWDNAPPQLVLSANTGTIRRAMLDEWKERRDSEDSMQFTTRPIEPDQGDAVTLWGGLEQKHLPTFPWTFEFKLTRRDGDDIERVLPLLG